VEKVRCSCGKRTFYFLISIAIISSWMVLDNIFIKTDDYE
jgi:hypothetical protein